jgi:hypothetical protein
MVERKKEIEKSPCFHVPGSKQSKWRCIDWLFVYLRHTIVSLIWVQIVHVLGSKSAFGHLGHRPASDRQGGSLVPNRKRQRRPDQARTIICWFQVGMSFEIGQLQQITVCFDDVT